MTDLTKEEIRQRLGNISQIRDLLFGDRMEDYEQRFRNLEKRLNNLDSQLSQWQQETNQNFIKLQEKISEELSLLIDSVDKKLQYLSITTQEETEKLQQELTFNSHKNYQNLESLQNNVKGEVKFLQNGLSQTKESLERDIQVLKQQIILLLEEKTSELTKSKISREDLGNLLFDLCLKVKGSELLANSQTEKTNGNTMKTDLFLPENKPETGS